MFIKTLFVLILFKFSNTEEALQRNNIPNIWGANVKLGQLYDGREDQVSYEIQKIIALFI